MGFVLDQMTANMLFLSAVAAFLFWIVVSFRKLSLQQEEAQLDILYHLRDMMKEAQRPIPYPTPDPLYDEARNAFLRDFLIKQAFPPQTQQEDAVADAYDPTEDPEAYGHYEYMGVDLSDQGDGVVVTVGMNEGGFYKMLQGFTIQPDGNVDWWDEHPPD